jgi:hypothetical protein
MSTKLKCSHHVCKSHGIRKISVMEYHDNQPIHLKKLNLNCISYGIPQVLSVEPLVSEITNYQASNLAVKEDSFLL